MTRAWLAAMVVVVAGIVALCACELVVDTSDLHPQVAPVPPGSPCPPANGGPTLVHAGSFCIDATEVTEGQFAKFVTMVGSGNNADLFPTLCQSNGHTAVIAMGTDASMQPMANVDWCDASAFCKWAGKRLCGKIDGGPATFSNPTDLGTQWYSACSQAGAKTYPYGDTFQATACTGSAASPTDVGTVATCEGGYPGVFDLSGNLAEWEDTCNNTGSNAFCRIRGGSFNGGSAFMACGVGGHSWPYSKRINSVGFRCCAP
jgi:formylglycine-generating enzyme required for sulfatase activity